MCPPFWNLKKKKVSDSARLYPGCYLPPPPPPPPDVDGAPSFEAGGGPKKKVCYAPPFSNWIRPCVTASHCVDKNNYVFVITADSMGRRRMKHSRCIKPSCTKVAHFENDTASEKIALESKRLIHTWWTWCQITWKIIFCPIQQKSMVFNQ